MSHEKFSLFPRTIDALVEDLNQKKSHLEANAARLQIPPSALESIVMTVDAVNAAKAVTDDRERRSKNDTDTRDRALHAAKTLLRRIIEFYVVDNPAATPEDYETLHIPVPAPHHLLPPPELAPGIRRLYSEDFVLVALFFDAATGRNAKPEGVKYIQAACQLGGTPPATVDAMIERRNATASPMRIPFDVDGDFEILYIAFRWIGTRGDFGPWSEIYRVVIVR
jgi:hypothetical protein